MCKVQVICCCHGSGGGGNVGVLLTGAVLVAAAGPMIMTAVTSLVMTVLFWLAGIAGAILLTAGIITGGRYVLFRALESGERRQVKHEQLVFQQRMLEAQSTSRPRIRATIHSATVLPSREKIKDNRHA